MLYLKSLIKGKELMGNEGAGDRGVGKGSKGDMSSSAIPMLKFFMFFWLTHYCNGY